jgi:tetratricopeptide (TPR) repeat protein
MFTEGKHRGEEGLRIVEADNHPASLMFASWGSGLLSLRQGDLPKALPLLERAVSACQDADLLSWFPHMAAALGEAYTLGGHIAAAVPLLTRALELAAGRRRWHLAICYISLGEAHLLAGRLDQAQTQAERALAHACAHQERGHQACALRLLGEIAVHRNPPESAQAEAHYQQALALAEELGMRPLQAHCHRSLGTLYARTGQWERARAALSTAIALYRAMEMTFWLPQAEATLAEVGG